MRAAPRAWRYIWVAVLRPLRGVSALMPDAPTGWRCIWVAVLRPLRGVGVFTRDATTAWRCIGNPLRRSRILWLLTVLLAPCSLPHAPCSYLYADDVGIDKARLIEEEPGKYLLEVDTTPRLAAAYRVPILPGRFQPVGGLQREQEAGYLIVRYRFENAEQPLSADDKLLLPWNRAGVSLTAQWSDGSIQQALFLRDLEGIRVPIRTLKPTQETTMAVVERNFMDGVRHCITSPTHWVFVLGICLIAAGWRLVRMLLLLAAGHGVSLVLVDLGLPSVPLRVAELCFVVAALLAARMCWLGVEVSGRLDPILLILGVLHGLGYAGILSESGTSGVQLLAALLAFNLGVDLVHLIAAGAMRLLAFVFGKLQWPRWGPALSQLSTGGLACGLLLASMTGSGLSVSLPHDREDQQAQFELPGLAGRPGQRTGMRLRPARGMTDPVMSYITVEPFEVRHEILVSGQVARDWLPHPPIGDLIEIEDQQTWKESATQELSESIALQIDGQPAEPIIARANFVTIGANGIYTRTEPVVEPVGTAVLGVTFVYETADMARRVNVQWDLFSEKVTRIPSTTTDPFGGRQHYLAAQAPTLEWESRLAGYRVPEVKQVAVVRRTYPLVSLGIIALVMIAYVFVSRRGSQALADASATVGLAAAVLMYPFVRTPLELPWGTGFQSNSVEAAAILDDLLTNVYRSFDLRDENAIYDRLAVSVMGDQLTDVYLENRRSLELEDRGGARAKVDEVEILEVREVDAVDSGGLSIDASWTVSGSVSHFGHTHYRRNRYDAEVTIAPLDGVWKIRTIEVAEQQREL